MESNQATSCTCVWAPLYSTILGRTLYMYIHVFIHIIYSHIRSCIYTPCTLTSPSKMQCIYDPWPSHEKTEINQVDINDVKKYHNVIIYMYVGINYSSVLHRKESNINKYLNQASLALIIYYIHCVCRYI